MDKAIRIFSLLLLTGILVFTAPVAGISDDNYQSLLDELQRKVDEADRKMVAHPTFLDELRALVEKYRAKIRNIFLSDDFSDGDYTNNPIWQVTSGGFHIDTENRLRSDVSTGIPASAPVRKEKSLSPEQQAVGLLLKGILGGAQKEPTQQAAPEPKPENAVIKTRVDIDPAFELDLSFASTSEWGSMEIALLGGDAMNTRYRLIYHAAASEKRPIEIVRERNGREYTIESALQYPDLDDSMSHRLQWIRSLDGTMTVWVDGKEVLRTIEVYYRDAFTGLALVNKGGTYAVNSIRVMSPQPLAD